MKKHMGKKALAFLMAVLMLAAAGCSQGGETSSVGGSTEGDSSEQGSEKVTFTIAVGLNPLSKDEDFNNKEIFKLAEEATNVHIEWMPIAAADATDKVNIMLTSDLPDAFLGLIGTDQIASNMDSFADLAKDDLLKTYAPHIVEDYESSLSNGLDIVTWPDGSIRSLMTGPQTSYENDAEGIMFMNKEWLDKVGMDVPTTTEEFYNVLKAFKEQDANGNGVADEIPFEPSQSDWCSKIMNVANPWGIAGTDSSDESAYKMVTDGKVVGTVDTEEFRSFMEYAHMLVSEGLMDQEMFSQTSEQYHSKINEGVVGCYYTWSPYADMSESEAEKWVPVPVLEAEDGPGYVKTGSQAKFNANRCGFCITSACTDIPRLLEWWDYMGSSTELKYTSRFGPQGEAWDIDEDGNVFEKLPEDLTDDYTIENYKYTQGMVDMGSFITESESATVLKENSFTSWYRIDCVEQMHDYCLPVERQLPLRFVAPEKTSERTFMETELFTYIGNFIATSVLNGVDDASWNNHLEQLKTYQYYEWLQWYQDYLDKAF